MKTKNANKEKEVYQQNKQKILKTKEFKARK